MTLAHLTPLFLIWVAAVISPGPDFVVVLRTAAVRGRVAGTAVAVGVAAGIACWAVLAMTGLGILLTRYDHVYAVVRGIGAAFLVGYGLFVLWHTWGRRTEAGSHSPTGSEPTTLPSPSRPGFWSPFRLGLATNLANPKAVAFFGALFASILPAGLTPTDRAVIVVAMVAIALAWFAALAWTASLGAVSAFYARVRRSIDSVMGGLLTGIGVLLFPR